MDAGPDRVGGEPGALALCAAGGHVADRRGVMNGYMGSRPVIRVIEISSKIGTSAPDECGDCSRTSRRRFVGQVSGVAIAAALASELGIPDAAALSVGETSGAQTHPDVRTYPLPAAAGATIDRAPQVTLVRYQTRVFPFALPSPHENPALRWR